MITIDQDAGTITVDGTTLPMASAEAFRILSDAWIDAALRAKHQYTFTWLGRPVIQLADDLLRLQEIVYRVQPDVIVETGIAHGGSLIFHSSLCKLLGHGRVIGIDIEIRPHNRAAIEAHPLAPFITMFEGSSIDPAIIRAVKTAIAPDETVLVVLDSNHTKAHVRAELDAYAPLVAPGSYIVAMDGHVMEAAATSPLAAADWPTNNPNAAVREFAALHPEFIQEEPAFLFNESTLADAVTGFRGGVLRRAR
jgi:cephalosporin hydroxylase